MARATHRPAATPAMPVGDRPITSEMVLRSLGKAADQRRQDLLGAVFKSNRRKKALTMSAGLLALVSAGSVAATLTELVGKGTVDVLAALSAFVSGTVSLIVSVYHNDDAIMTMSGGATKYLELRDRITGLLLRREMSEEDRRAHAEQISQKYCELDGSYSRYLPPGAGSSPTIFLPRVPAPVPVPQGPDKRRRRR